MLWRPTRRRDDAAFCLEDKVLSLTSNAERSARKLVKSQSSATSDAILAAVLKSLEDDKAEDVVQIDLRGKSEIGDHMVICSGRSTRQVASISEKLKDRLKTELGIFSKLEGKGTGDWVLVDTGDVIVHVFRPEVREFYQLDEMWLETGSIRPSDD
ncbi:MAG: ribosome silencing factor [Planktomarina sp.]|nr:ribosome silencing factor [Planktomarina sp.]MDS9946265.1 ribosome silencing factor [Planktomarina sp.]|tara:strand:- start:2330 stop:2797 length:468 start_codon:yes stop_codon:yes gene_type:complete